MNKEELLLNLKDNLNIELSEDKFLKLNKYYELLKEWNNKFNLTTIIDEKEVYLKHFYDSLCLSLVTKLDRNIKVCDMGTGAGFPGIVLKIVFDKLDMTLIESNNKKCTFLNEIIKKLDLKNIKVECNRIEDYAKNNLEVFDIVTTRAVSRMRIISELGIPMLKLNGLFLPLKSHIDDELEESKNIVKLLGGNIEGIYNYNLPDGLSIRCIPIIKKIKESPNGYPRVYSQILKKVI